jgi:hypothetical protein
MFTQAAALRVVSGGVIHDEKITSGSAGEEGLPRVVRCSPHSMTAVCRERPAIGYYSPGDRLLCVDSVSAEVTRVPFGGGVVVGAAW